MTKLAHPETHIALLKKTTKSVIEVLEHVTEAHEWCSYPPSDKRCSCGRSKIYCSNDGRCDGCKMYKKAKRALKALKEAENG